MKTILNPPNPNKPQKKFFGKTKLTPELQFILLHFHLIAYVKAGRHRVTFFIIDRPPQRLTGRFADIVALLCPLLCFCKIHKSFLINMDHVFVWVVEGDGLRVLLKTGQDASERTVLIGLLPSETENSLLTPEGVNKAELALRIKKCHCLAVSESGKKEFKRLEKQCGHIKRLWQCLNTNR